MMIIKDVYICEHTERARSSTLGEVGGEVAGEEWDFCGHPILRFIIIDPFHYCPQAVKFDCCPVALLVVPLSNACPTIFAAIPSSMN